MPLHESAQPAHQAVGTLRLRAFCSLATALYVIGPRTAEMLANVLMSPANFRGELMSDGYVVYREFLHAWDTIMRTLDRLRGWEAVAAC